MPTLWDPSDERPKSSHDGPGLLRQTLTVLAIGTVLFCGLGVAAFWFLSALLWWDVGDRITVLGEAETTEKVSSILYGQDLWNREYYHENTYRSNGTVAVISQLTRPISGLHGFRGLSTSGGMQGDGDDWYEAYLSPELAADLAAKLGPSCVVKDALHPVASKHTPKWWPTYWPPGVIRREQNLSYFVLTPGGGKAWFYVFRW